MVASPLVWIAASMAVYALVTNLAWAASLEPDRLRPLARWVARLPRTRATTLAEIARLSYFFGIPVVALGLRIGRPAHWGLGAPPSVWSALLAVAVAAVVTVIVGGGDIWLERSAGRARSLAPAVPSADVVASFTLLALVREAHWAFFRTGPLGIGLRNTTFAVFLSLGLLALEAWSNPWRRAAFDDIRACRRLAEGAGLAVQSALVFLVTGSSLMCLAAQLASVVALAATSGRYRREAGAGARRPATGTLRSGASRPRTAKRR